MFGKVQLELHQFGLLIYNADVKQLVNVSGHEYVSYLGQKTQQEASNQAKVDVAEANAEVAEVVEANAELAKKKAILAKGSEMAEVEAAKAVSLREADQKKKVEKMNALTMTEKLKAELLSKASIEYETKVSSKS